MKNILFWKYSIGYMFLLAVIGLLGQATALWSPHVGSLFLVLSFGLALNCIFQGQKLVYSDDLNGWFSTYAGAIGMGALILIFLQNFPFFSI